MRMQYETSKCKGCIGEQTCKRRAEKYKSPDVDVTELFTPKRESEHTIHIDVTKMLKTLNYNVILKSSLPIFKAIPPEQTAPEYCKTMSFSANGKRLEKKLLRILCRAKKRYMKIVKLREDNQPCLIKVNMEYHKRFWLPDGGAR